MMTTKTKAIQCLKELEKKIGFSLEPLIEYINDSDEKQGRNRITNLIREIGIPANLNGYNYIKTAIVLAYENEEILKSITKQLYPDIAKEYKSTVSKVERAIRYAIEVAWNNRGGIRDMFTLYPTNSQLIATLVDVLKEENNPI